MRGVEKQKTLLTFRQAGFGNRFSVKLDRPSLPGSHLDQLGVVADARSDGGALAWPGLDAVAVKGRAHQIVHRMMRALAARVNPEKKAADARKVQVKFLEGSFSS